MRTIQLFVVVLLCCWSSTSGSFEHGQLLEVLPPRLMVVEFSYMPGLEGYHYNYTLADGSSRDEFGFVLDPEIPNPDLDTLNNVLPTERDDYRPKKNRKLSPGSLKSAAG